MALFYLIRHGETNWSINEKYLLKGEDRDLPPLTSTGIQQVKDLSNDVRLKKAELILSSPYTRALQTAAILSKNLNLDISVELKLREWQPDLNLEISNLTQLQNAIDDYVKENGIYPPGITKTWEAKSALKERAEKVLKKYSDYGCVIVVTHEQVIKSWVNNHYIPYCFINELKLV